MIRCSSFSRCIRGQSNFLPPPEYTDYKIWSDVATLTSDNTEVIQDIILEGKSAYKYRLIDDSKNLQLLDWTLEDIGPVTIQRSSNETTVNTIEMHYDDIFLSDKNYMFALRYNPKISSFKWVTQDSITNTLGGKYPLVRRNGD